MRHLTDDIDGVLGRGRVLICDRDRKWSYAVREFLEREGVRIQPLRRLWPFSEGKRRLFALPATYSARRQQKVHLVVTSSLQGQSCPSSPGNLRKSWPAMRCQPEAFTADRIGHGRDAMERGTVVHPLTAMRMKCGARVRRGPLVTSQPWRGG
jgi:hypothetical protein